MNSWQLPETSTIMHSLGWALFYSIFQGLLLYSVLWILLKMLKNANANTRYNISFLFFSGLSVWFADTWFTQWQRLQSIPVYVTELPVNAELGVSWSFRTMPQSLSGNTFLQNILPSVEKNMPLIVSVYIIGLIFMLVRFILGIYQVKRLRTTDTEEPATDLKNLFRKWQGQLNISIPVNFLVSKSIATPMMVGILKPVILIPIATLSHLNTDQLEAILLHELAHIKRRDYLLNVFQTIVEAILFFNPFVWLISDIIHREREHSCDDLVIANTGSALPYAKALAQLETIRSGQATLAMAATGSKNHLFNRIKRIMEMKKNTTNYNHLTIVLVLVITVLISITWLSPSFAQKAKDKQDTAIPQKEEKKIVKKEKIVLIDEDGNRKEYDSIDKLPKEEKEKLKRDLEKEEADGLPGSGTAMITKNKSIEKKGDDDEDVALIVKNALNEVDFDKIGKEVNEALKEVSVAMKEAGDAMKQVDWAEVSKGLQSKLEEIKKQLPDSSENKEMVIKIKHKLDETGKAFDEINEKIEKRNGKKQLESETAYAHASAGNVHVSAPTYEKMLERMEEGGLIDRTNGYSIEKKNNKLFINDIEQTNYIFKQYEKYFKNGNVTIKGDKDHIKINVKN